MADTKMVSMKRSEKDKRKDMGEPCGIESVAPDYPWGLTLNLGTDELEKLGLKTMPALGTEMTITAKVKVTRCEESAYEGPNGKETESRSLTLQVTDIGI